MKAGSRVRGKRDGSRGSVKTFGRVSGKKGVWVAVDWDPAGATSPEGPSTSHCRPDDLLEAQTLLEAIKTKHESIELETDEEREGKSGSDWGWSLHVKARDIRALESIVLSGSLFGCCARSNEISAACPNLSELDVSSSLLSEWEPVWDILSQCSALRLLNIGNNPLSPLADTYPPAAGPSVVSTMLRELVLNNTGITWCSVNLLLARLPRLRCLHLCSNNFIGVELDCTLAPHLVSLHLDHNCIAAWSEVHHLRLLRRLRWLSLSHNPLADVSSLVWDVEQNVGDQLYPCTGQAVMVSEDIATSKQTTMAMGSGTDNDVDGGRSWDHSDEDDTDDGFEGRWETGKDIFCLPLEVLSRPMLLVSDKGVESMARWFKARMRLLYQDRLPQTEGYFGVRSAVSTLPAPSDVRECGGASGSAQPSFHRLQLLRLEGTALNDWEHLVNIGAMAGLCEVRLTGIPLCDNMDPLQRRQFLLAHLPQVKILDGSVILPGERDAAERAFLRDNFGSTNPPLAYSRARLRASKSRSFGQLYARESKGRVLKYAKK
ncbi:hypothetical protein CYMTET_51752 [Cymbomonas tetramitiformis]|uniref:Uncharacterized protein n=1 Tax=Cymbomonas tetramitiformis TaxID=36881 RepID=A0AAE0BLV7_9CHLO|nr:hypothetical protein CYMTET_51752 [Cymbomonas tetramitiformis]